MLQQPFVVVVILCLWCFSCFIQYFNMYVVVVICMLLQQLFVICCNTMFIVFQLFQPIVVAVCLVLLHCHAHCVAVSSLWGKTMGTS